MSGCLSLVPRILPWGTLTDAGREHIKTHKYKSGAYTPLDNLLNRWWYFLTDLLPRSLAPNMVTLMGFTPIAISYMLAWQASPSFDTPPPRWLCYWSAFSLFLYQTFDAMDGKQARRIGASTPLGQLFDHGLDCLACLSHHSMAALIFMPGASMWCLAGLAALQTGFFFAQWQEHYTGVLCTSFGPVGVTETQYALMGLGVFGGVMGPDGLQASMRATIGSTRFFPSALKDMKVGEFAIKNMMMGEFAIMLWVMFCASLILISFCKTLKQAPKTKEDVPGSREPPGQRWKRALLDLTPIIVLNVSLFCWGCLRATPQSARLICLYTGLLFFFYTAQMIVHTMAMMPFCPLQPTLIPYGFLVVESQFKWVHTLVFGRPDVRGPLSWFIGSHEQSIEDAWINTLLVTFVAIIGQYVLIWVVNVTLELKEHLGIYVLTVGKPPKSQTTAEKGAPAQETTKSSSATSPPTTTTTRRGGAAKRAESPGIPKTK